MKYLKLSGRSEEQIALVEAYCREQGLFHDDKTPEAEYSELLTLDLGTVEPSLAGPKRPQDRVILSQAADSFHKALPSLIKPKSRAAAVSVTATANRANRNSASWEQEGGSPTAHRRRGSERARARSAGRKELAQARQRSHRRHHFLHQHFEPFSDDRRWIVSEESGRKRLVGSAVGEDVARAGLESRPRLSRERRPDAVSREVEI